MIVSGQVSSCGGKFREQDMQSFYWAQSNLTLCPSVPIESLIGEVYVKRIIDKLQAALSKAKDLSEAGNTEPSVSFICDVASNFFSSVKGCLLMPSSEDLLFTIFQLCAKSQATAYLSGMYPFSQINCLFMLLWLGDVQYVRLRLLPARASRRRKIWLVIILLDPKCPDFIHYSCDSPSGF